MNLRSYVLTAALTFAAASSATAADVFVVHGIPGVPVDVYVSAAGAPVPPIPVIGSFQPKAVLRVSAGPGTFDIRIYPIGADPRSTTPVISALGVAIRQAAS